MAEADLQDLIDRWLDGSARSLLLQFAPKLEARFEADTRRERSRELSIFGAIGFASGVILYMLMHVELPDVASLGRLLYLDISMPLGFAVAAIVWFDPPPPVREGLTTFANVVCITTVIYLFAISRAPFGPVFAAVVTVLMVYSAVGIQLRFRYAVVAVLLILSAYAWGLSRRPELSPTSLRSLLSLAVCTGAYLLLANWRMERECRRNYLVSLRERLQRQDLSLRNVELDELARRDPLTGLANRRAYDGWLVSSWQQATADGSVIGLIVVDVDRFKDFNDFYGHAAGDLCLQKIARCLRDQLRGTSDLVARLGGEEFAILLPGLTEDLCADVAERLREAVARLELPNVGSGMGGLVTVSAGVASQPASPGNPAISLFAAADAALYQAKATGRNRVCVGTMAEVGPAVRVD